MLSNCGSEEDSWESPGLQGDQTNQHQRKSTLNIRWKDWCWNGSYNTLATWCDEPTHWETLWYQERSRAGGEGDDRGSDGWTASSTQWAWVWESSGRWWWIAKPGVLQSMGSQRVRHDRANELNWRKRRATFWVTAKTRWACFIHMVSTIEGPPWASTVYGMCMLCVWDTKRTEQNSCPQAAHGLT